MVKKYIVAIDSNIPLIDNKSIRMFMFSTNERYDTIEAAELSIRNVIETKSENDKTAYSIIPIYTKN